MRFSLPYRITEPAANETRTVRKFAWVPIRIHNNYVWLERYEECQVYIKDAYPVTIEEEKLTFVVGRWVTISKRTID